MRNMEPTNLGTLCGGEERGGPILGFLCKHPDSDRLCLADVFFSFTLGQVYQMRVQVVVALLVLLVPPLPWRRDLVPQRALLAGAA